MCTGAKEKKKLILNFAFRCANFSYRVYSVSGNFQLEAVECDVGSDGGGGEDGRFEEAAIGPTAGEDFYRT